MLKLNPGPVVEYSRYEDYQEDPLVDVTKNLHQYLFEPCEIAANFTLADFFKLFERCPSLVEIFHRDYSREFLDESKKGYLAAENELEDEHIEFIKLDVMWSHDTDTNQLYVTRLNMSGEGVVLKNDAESGYKAGERISWGITGKSVRQLLNTPIKLCEELVILDEGLKSLKWGSVEQSFKIKQYNIGEIIHAILWELSFYGTPESAKEFHDQLMEQVKSVKSGEGKLHALTDIIKDLQDDEDNSIQLH